MKTYYVLISIIVILIIVLGAVIGVKGMSQAGVEEDNIIEAPVSVMGRYEEQTKTLSPNYQYKLKEAHEVDGRQGIAYDNGNYYVSGSTTLSIYDKDWNKVLTNSDPFEGIKDDVNHIGDIDVYNGELYAGIEFFMDGWARNIQVAVYDAKDLSLKRTYSFSEESGQSEVSGITIDPDTKSIWMCSWADGESGRYLYRYDLEKGEYIGKYHLQASPQWIQGIAYLNGFIYIACDDGIADLGEADHIYRVKVDVDKTNMPVLIERTLDDVTLQGEMEGLSFDKENKQLLICYNRGAQIINGMTKGLYDGYEKEWHEIFVYDMK